jgi:hypothetical protein
MGSFNNPDNVMMVHSNCWVSYNAKNFTESVSAIVKGQSSYASAILQVIPSRGSLKVKQGTVVREQQFAWKKTQALVLGRNRVVNTNTSPDQHPPNLLHMQDFRSSHGNQ